MAATLRRVDRSTALKISQTGRKNCPRLATGEGREAGGKRNGRAEGVQTRVCRLLVGDRRVAGLPCDGRDGCPATEGWAPGDGRVDCPSDGRV